MVQTYSVPISEEPHNFTLWWLKLLFCIPVYYFAVFQAVNLVLEDLFKCLISSRLVWLDGVTQSCIYHFVVNESKLFSNIGYKMHNGLL